MEFHELGDLIYERADEEMDRILKLLEKRMPEIECLPNKIMGVIDSNTFRISTLFQSEDITKYADILREKANEGFECILELREDGLNLRTFFNV